MNKTVRDIGITFVIMGIICFAFWQIGWFTSTAVNLTVSSRIAQKRGKKLIENAN